MNNRNNLLKLIIIGSSNTGKTCIVLRYTDDTFTDTFLTTVGVDFKVKETVDDIGKPVRLQVWDTAGQEQFHTIAKSYFRGAHGILLCFSLKDRFSFEKTHMWMDSIREAASQDVSIVLVGNKVDHQPREISKEEGEALASEFGVPYFETSAKTGENVNETFQYLVNDACKKLREQPKAQQPKQVTLDSALSPSEGKKKDCC